MMHAEEWLAGVKIGIIGLGYVGLPLAVEFGKKVPVVGFDTKATRIEALRAGYDETLETDANDLRSATQVSLTTNPEYLQACNVFIVTVPAPIDIVNMMYRSYTLLGLVFHLPKADFRDGLVRG
jgi:UDP-N-acetyl-D-galactosamine dehydrogenase